MAAEIGSVCKIVSNFIYLYWKKLMNNIVKEHQNYF